jgi:hypothetical protein
MVNRTGIGQMTSSSAERGSLSVPFRPILEGARKGGTEKQIKTTPNQTRGRIIGIQYVTLQPQGLPSLVLMDSRLDGLNLPVLKPHIQGPRVAEPEGLSLIV